MSVSGQLHASAALPLDRVFHGNHWIAGWVGDVEAPAENRTLAIQLIASDGKFVEAWMT
jgi:hypothetical protein